MTWRRVRHLCVPLAGVVALAAGLPVSAQTAPDDAPAASPAAEAPAPAPSNASNPAPRPVDSTPFTPDEIRRLTSDTLVRLSLTRLREIEEPELEDYQITATGLRMARRLNPDDVELIRLEAEAWQSIGDEERAMPLIAEIVRRDPSDTVAQLRLITHRLGKLQTVEARLAAYERFLGDEGRALDPSIRSRLALDAALLAREFGDESRFTDLLTTATTLDVTNKEAAVLFAAVHLDRTTDPRERCDILANVLLADPADPQAHWQLSRELYAQGAFKGARRFGERRADLLTILGVSTALEDLLENYLMTLFTDGPDEVLKQLKSIENFYLAQRLRFNRHQREIGKDPGPDPTYEPIAAPLEMIRLAVAFGRKDDAEVAAAARRIAERHAAELRDMRQPTDSEKNPSPPEEIAKYTRRTLLSTSTARLWAGVETDLAAADIETLASDPEEPLGPDALARLRGLVAVRRGEYDAAVALLTPLADNDAIAKMGLAITAELRGDERTALSWYARAAKEHPATVAGAGARLRVETILGKPIAQSPTAAALDEWALNLAPWIDGFTKSPYSFMSLSAQHVPSRVGVLDRVTLRLTLRNVSRFPLAVGDESPIQPRLLLTPKLTARNDDMTRFTQAEVFVMDRRLRLMPGEAITVDLWASRSRLGVWLDVFASTGLTLRWRIMQGFRVKGNAQFDAGPLTLTADSDLLTRENTQPATNADEVAQAMRDAPGGRALVHAMLRVVGNAVSRGADAAEVEQRRRMFVEVVSDRLASATDFEKFYCLPLAMRAGLLSPGSRVSEVVRDNAPAETVAILILTGYEPLDAVRRYAEHPDPDVRKMAQLSLAVSERFGVDPATAPAPAPLVDEAPAGAAPPPAADPTAEPAPEGDPAATPPAEQPTPAPQ